MFIFQGGKENNEWFDFCRKYGADKLNAHLRAMNDEDTGFFWTCHKQAKKGDEAYIYLTAPLSRIVGKVRLVDKPFQNFPNRFDNSFMDNKLCVEVEFVESYETENLTIKEMRNLFGVDWGWVRYPRGSVKIPEHILPVFNEWVELENNAV